MIRENYGEGQTQIKQKLCSAFDSEAIFFHVSNMISSGNSSLAGVTNIQQLHKQLDCV